MDYLRGKLVKADKDIELLNIDVDGKIYSLNDFYLPKIRKNRIYVVEKSDEYTVVLRNSEVNSWIRCELPLDYIDDFKIVNRSQI